MLAEFHNKYDRGFAGKRQYLCIERSLATELCWLRILAIPSAAEDGSQRMKLVWTVYTACTPALERPAWGGSDSLKEKTKQRR